MFFKKFLHYLNPLNLFKKSEGEGLNLRMMHGINKISFFAFLMCLAVMLRTAARHMSSAAGNRAATWLWHPRLRTPSGDRIACERHTRGQMSL